MKIRMRHVLLYGSALSLLFVLFQNFSNAPSTSNVPSPVLESGGSNFAMIRQNEFMTEMTFAEKSVCEADIRQEILVLSLESIILRKTKLILNWLRSSKVDREKLAWFFGISTTSYTYAGNMHCMNLKARGVLSTQHAINLQNLIKKIKSLGFDQINFRFAPIDQSAPGHWKAWNENGYQANWNLIVNTRKLILNTLQASNGKSPRVFFDLGLELGGAWTIPWSKENKTVLRSYIFRLWRNYAQNFGVNDTLGFSIVPAAANMITAQIALFDEAGYGRPVAYGFDVYGNQEMMAKGDYSSLDLQFLRIKNELAVTGELSKEIFLQETYFNSVENRALIDLDYYKVSNSFALYFSVAIEI